ncbi:hypothetical protein THAOC_23148, partial [Thalassiosira oceanica]
MAGSQCGSALSEDNSELTELRHANEALFETKGDKDKKFDGEGRPEERDDGSSVAGRSVGNESSTSDLLPLPVVAEHDDPSSGGSRGSAAHGESSLPARRSISSYDVVDDFGRGRDEADTPGGPLSPPPPPGEDTGRDAASPQDRTRDGRGYPLPPGLVGAGNNNGGGNDDGSADTHSDLDSKITFDSTGLPRTPARAASIEECMTVRDARMESEFGSEALPATKYMPIVSRSEGAGGRSGGGGTGDDDEETTISLLEGPPAGHRGGGLMSGGGGLDVSDQSGAALQDGSHGMGGKKPSGKLLATEEQAPLEVRRLELEEDHGVRRVDLVPARGHRRGELVAVDEGVRGRGRDEAGGWDFRPGRTTGGRQRGMARVARRRERHVHAVRPAVARPQPPPVGRTVAPPLVRTVGRAVVRTERGTDPHGRPHRRPVRRPVLLAVPVVEAHGGVQAERTAVGVPEPRAVGRAVPHDRAVDSAVGAPLVDLLAEQRALRAAQHVAVPHPIALVGPHGGAPRGPNHGHGQVDPRPERRGPAVRRGRAGGTHREPRGRDTRRRLGEPERRQRGEGGEHTYHQRAVAVGPGVGGVGRGPVRVRGGAGLRPEADGAGVREDGGEGAPVLHGRDVRRRHRERLQGDVHRPGRGL